MLWTVILMDYSCFTGWLLEFYLSEQAFGKRLSGELDSQPPCRAEARDGITENWKRNGNHPCGFSLRSHVLCFQLAWTCWTRIFQVRSWAGAWVKWGRIVVVVCPCCAGWVGRHQGTGPLHIMQHPRAVCSVLLFAPPSSLGSQENGASKQTSSIPWLLSR